MESSKEEGFVTIFFALVAMTMLSVGALAIDYSRSLRDQRNRQMVADAASYSAANLLHEKDPSDGSKYDESDILAQVQEVLRINGFDPSAVTVKCGVWDKGNRTFTQCESVDPACTCTDDRAQAVGVEIPVLTQTTLAGILNVSDVSQAVSSVSWRERIRDYCPRPFGIHLAGVYAPGALNPVSGISDLTSCGLNCEFTSEPGTGNWGQMVIPGVTNGKNRQLWEKHMYSRDYADCLDYELFNEAEAVYDANPGSSGVKEYFEQLVERDEEDREVVLPIFDSVSGGPIKGASTPLKIIGYMKAVIQSCYINKSPAPVDCRDFNGSGGSNVTLSFEVKAVDVDPEEVLAKQVYTKPRVLRQ
jgi:Flp pilus assembly protein TadG